MAKYDVPASDFTTELAPGNIKKAQSNAEATSAVMLSVDPSKVVPIPGFNVRVPTPDYLNHKSEVKESIRANGWFPNKPLGGYIGKNDANEDTLFLTDGYTRWDAVMELIAEGTPIEKVTFVAKPQGQSLSDLTVALVQDNEGRALSVIEKSIVVKRLVGYGLTTQEIAPRLAMTDRYVSDLLTLAGAPTKVRDQIIAGKVSATEAIKALRADPKKAAEKIDTAVKAAAEKGKKKATGKDVKKAAAEPQKSGASQKARTVGDVVRMTFSFHWKQGDIVPYADIALVRGFDGAEWWNFVDENTKADVVIEETVTFEVVMIKAAPVDANTTTEPATETVDGEVEAHLDAIADSTAPVTEPVAGAEDL